MLLIREADCRSDVGAWCRVSGVSGASGLNKFEYAGMMCARRVAKDLNEGYLSALFEDWKVSHVACNSARARVL